MCSRLSGRARVVWLAAACVRRGDRQLVSVESFNCGAVLVRRACEFCSIRELIWARIIYKKLVRAEGRRFAE